MDGLGRDISAMPDLDFGYKSGFENLRERLLRRLTTPRGSLYYDPDYGMDVRLLLNEGMSAENQYEFAVLIAAELEKDEAVFQALVFFAVLDQTRVRIRSEVLTSDDTVNFILDLDRVTSEVLNAATE
jgi:phage baseplate assembly protein W